MDTPGGTEPEAVIAGATADAHGGDDADAHGGDEQRTGPFTGVEERPGPPFTTAALGVEVTVHGIDTVFRNLLRKPGFTWSEHGEALLRRHKPWYYESEPRTGVSVIGDRLSELLGAGRR